MHDIGIWLVQMRPAARITGFILRAGLDFLVKHGGVERRLLTIDENGKVSVKMDRFRIEKQGADNNEPHCTDDEAAEQGYECGFIYSHGFQYTAAMKLMVRWFAHAGEFHTEQTSDLEHFTTQTWFIVPAYAAALGLIWFGFGRVPHLANYRFVGILTLSLVTAFFSYGFAPALSVVAIIIGFATSLLLMLASTAAE